MSFAGGIWPFPSHVTEAGKSVLDVACGDGLYKVVLGKMGAKVAGQDLSEPPVLQARKAMERFGVAGEAKVGDARELLFEADSFDAVLSADFMEHIPTDVKSAFLNEVFRVLRPGGVLVIKTPNLTYLRLAIWAKRVAALLRGRSPFGLHIAHTRNNPDNEHHGLTTRDRLHRLLNDRMFQSAEFFPARLEAAGVPHFLQENLPRLPYFGRLFNRDLIVRTRKPLFQGFFP